MTAPPPVPLALDATRLAAARLAATEAQPFLAGALYALTPVVVAGLDTFAIDARWRLLIDPAALARWSIEEVAGVLLHEVGHAIRDHCGRAKDSHVAESEALRWNYAADAEINDDLRDDGVILPGRAIYPEHIPAARHRVAEHYFHLLRTRDLDPPEDFVGCGSGAGGPDLLPEKSVRIGDTLPPGLGDGEALLVRRQVAVAVRDAQAARPGSVSGGWSRWAEAELNPVLDWRILLAAGLRQGVGSARGMVDYSYARPARRPSADVVLPSLVRPLPRVAMVIDTSGSVDDSLLAMAWTEALGCLRSLGVRRDLLRVYGVDTEATRLGHIGRRVELTGGGGTDMRIGISTAMSSRPQPNLVVVMTDGDTPWPDKPPPARVVIVLLSEPHVGPPPSWATTIRVPPTR